MKLAITLVLTLAAFGAGLYGMKTYLVPESETDAAVAGIDSLLAPEDTLSAADALENATGLPVDSVVTIELPDAPVVELERLRAQIAQTQQQLPELLARLDELESAVTAREDRFERAKEIANSIGTLDEEQLRGVLLQLNGRVLTDIYLQSSTRNRTKMLRALPAQVAGALIEHIAEGPDSRRPAPRAQAAATDSSASDTAS